MNSLTTKRSSLSNFLLSLSSTSSQTLYISLFSSSSSSSRRSYPSGETPNVRVSVWWDIQNCGVPTGSNAFKIAQSIAAGVRANGIRGPLQISAFGDVLCLSRVHQEALSITGVTLIHIPNGAKNSADRCLLVDLMHWVTQNPPPAHIFLISNDEDFAGILHRLRMNNYNILLSCKEGKNASAVLYSAATIMWHWDELARGESLYGRHFNQPPDGPFNSWYGHFKGALEDPYELPLFPKNSQASESTNKVEQSLDSRPRQDVLKQQQQKQQEEILNHIQDIVNRYPNRLCITELRSELESRVNMDKNFYTLKRLTSLLYSMQRFVQVIDIGEGKFLIRPRSSKFREQINEHDDTFVRSVVQVTPKVDVGTQPITRMVEESLVEEKTLEPNMCASHCDIAKNSLIEEKKEVTPEKLLDGPSTKKDDGKDTVDVEAVRSHLAPTEEQNPETVMGVFRRLWTKWFSTSNGVDRKDIEVPDKCHTSSVSLEKAIYEEHTISHSSNEKLTILSCLKLAEGSHSNTASSGDAKIDDIVKSEVSQGFVDRITSWLKNKSHVNTPTEHLSEETALIDNSGKHEDAPQLKKHEIFFKDAFWSSVESFLRTYRAFDIVLNSTSREQFAKRLKKDGPLALRSLEESDLRDLVEMLISDKKWVKEFPAQIPRFRLFVLPAKTCTLTQPPSNSNGISSFDNPQPSLSSIMQKTTSEKSRSEILSDCHKLLDELLEKNPEGFNISLFKRVFLEQYGYYLDYRKLGYPKLISILQIMPGVKVDDSLVLPDNVIYAPGIASLGGSDNETVESEWEELGSVKNANIIENPGKINVEYKSLKTHDDNDDELFGAEEERKSVNEEESSLLQILKSFETEQERAVDFTKDKQYSFVSNSVDNSKDRQTN